MQKFERAPANPHVVKMLERFLERARLGRMDYVAVLGMEGDDYTADFIGNTRSNGMACYALDVMRDRIKEQAQLSTMKWGNIDPKANMFFFDVSTEPACFDFVTWLVCATMKMKRAGHEGPLTVAFVRRNDEAVMPPGHFEKRDAFIKNVMQPALVLFEAIEDPTATMDGRQLQSYSLRDVVAGVQHGEEVPRIKPPQFARAAVAAMLRGKTPITITLREAPAWEHRNSKLEAWLRVAYELEQRGEKIIIVRDTAKADEPIGGFETCPQASRHLLTRAALYEQAKCNLFVANGPATMAQFGTKPWLMFVVVDPADPYVCNRPEWWKTYHGIEAGKDQLPWCTPQQRIVWADDTFENIMSAFDNLNLGATDGESRLPAES